jgi:hypothetical protein
VAALRMCCLHFSPAVGINAHSVICRDLLEELFNVQSERL